MAPEAAYEYVRSIRPRVLLAYSQWQVRIGPEFKHSFNEVYS